MLRWSGCCFQIALGGVLASKVVWGFLIAGGIEGWAFLEACVYGWDTCGGVGFKHLEAGLYGGANDISYNELSMDLTKSAGFVYLGNNTFVFWTFSGK